MLPALFYGTETWTALSHHVKRLELFLLCCLREAMHFPVHIRVPNIDVLRRANRVVHHPGEDYYNSEDKCRRLVAFPNEVRTAVRSSAVVGASLENG